MTSLADLLTNDGKKAVVVDECCVLIDEEVGDKSGLSGLAIKAGYGAIKGVSPGFVRSVVGDLLPKFAKALDPLYQEAKQSGGQVGSYFTQHRARVADALLAITDVQAERSRSGLVKGTYDRLRGSAKKNVEATVPRLGKLIERHTSNA